MNRYEESKVLKVRSKRERVFEFMKKNPNCNIYELSEKFKDYDSRLLSVYKWQYLNLYHHDIKSAVIIALDVFKYKIKLQSVLSKVEKEAFDLLEEWCGWEVHRNKRIIEAAERLRKT